MKKMNFIKITLDIFMSVIFVLLFNKMVINGLTFHEIAGLAIGIAFILHILLNCRWVVQITRNLFNKKVSIKTKIGYVIDFLLLICMAIIIFSGIMVSKIVFSKLGIQKNFNVNFKTLHMGISYLALALVGIHLGLHWNWIISMFKRIFKIPENVKLLNYLAKFTAILVLAFGLYSAYTSNYYSKSTMVFAQKNVQEGNKARVGQEVSAGNSSNEKAPVIGDSDKENSKSTGSKDGEAKPKPDYKNMPRPNPFNVLSTYLSIMAIFSILTYYLEMLLILAAETKRRTA